MNLSSAAPQLKRDPLGRCSFRSSHALSPPVFRSPSRDAARRQDGPHQGGSEAPVYWHLGGSGANKPDRKSTRLNSSHSSISYAVFCLKKKKKKKIITS